MAFPLTKPFGRVLPLPVNLYFGRPLLLTAGCDTPLTVPHPRCPGEEIQYTNLQLCHNEAPTQS